MEIEYIDRPATLPEVSSHTVDRGRLSGKILSQEEGSMERCYFCQTGTLECKRTTMTLHRGERVIMIENVPAKVCDSSGEAVFAGEVVERAHQLAEEILKTGKADDELAVPVGKMPGLEESCDQANQPP